MFLDPDKLAGEDPAAILDAASRGHLGLDHRFLRALLERRDQALPAAVAFAARDRSDDAVELAPELIALFRHWETPEAVPFLVALIREDPENVPDEVIEVIAAIGEPALEPLLALYKELDEAQSGEVAFTLANLRVRDPRILKLLLERLDYDLADTLILIALYGDPAALPSLKEAETALGPNDTHLRKEIEGTIAVLSDPQKAAELAEQEPFDIWALYPEKDDFPVDLLDEDERLELLSYPVATVRAAAAHSFFNNALSGEQRAALLGLAQGDPESEVRARAWEALIDSTDQPEVVEAMLARLRAPDTDAQERGGLIVGLAPEADRNEVRKAILDLYGAREGRAKALEAMWRSMHPSFRDHFSKHLDDEDLEVRRGAIWGVGYYGIKSEIEHLRKLFGNEELRSDALFAYALALPAEVSRGRMKGLLARIEKDAKGLSEMEEELVKAALDERLMLAGKEPVFRQQED